MRKWRNWKLCQLCGHDFMFHHQSFQDGVLIAATCSEAGCFCGTPHVVEEEGP